MADQRVLVAFASQSGSTAGIASAIAEVLRQAGLSVDCRPAGEVTDVAPYGAVILGSGVYVRRSASDGGGFLARHRAALATRRVWLFGAGPIGRGQGGPASAVGTDDCSVTVVASAVGARGAAVFGPIGLADDPGPPGLVERQRVSEWAAGIASELAIPAQVSPVNRGLRGCRHVPAAG
jgi:menaquinone-dependent protoporphyrinogen oxidase